MRVWLRQRVVAVTFATATLAGASLLASSNVAGASTTKGAGFCAAETYIAAHVQGGNVMTRVPWKTVAQEKTTLLNVDNALALAVKDAPTKAFAALAAKLVGTFTGWINDRAILAVRVGTNSAISFSASSALGIRIGILVDVMESGDYVWPVYAACPVLRPTGGQSVTLGKSPPKYWATPDEVAATFEARGAMIGSEMLSSTSLNLPTLASLKVGVTNMNSKQPGDNITFARAPRLSQGRWFAEYRVTANGRKFDVYLSLRNSLSYAAMVDGPVVSNVVSVHG